MSTFLPGNEYRLGVPNFLNAFPLWAGLENDAAVKLFPDMPSRLAVHLRAGKLDAALISSVEYLRHPEGFQYHSGLCIAALSKSHSIRIFTAHDDLPFEQKIPQLNNIYTDVASRSSVAQLEIILRELDSPLRLQEVSDVEERIAYLRDNEALLAIGDTALRQRHHPSYDLQSEYYKLFARGFVYALWVCRREKIAALAPILESAYAKWCKNQERFLDQASRRFGFELSFTRDYLTKVIEYKLTPERRQDLEFFAQRLLQTNCR